MGEVILWVFVHLVGLALVTGGGWARRPLLGSVLGFPVGLVSWGFAVSTFLWLGLPLAAAMAGAAIALLAGAGVAAWRRRADVDRRALLASAAALSVTGAVAALAGAFPVALITERSHAILLAATAIQRRADSLDFIWNGLHSPPVFQAALHAAAPLLGRPFLAALSPLCAIACALLLSVGGAALVGRWSGSRAIRALVGLVLAAALGSFLFAVQSTAVDVHAAAALFLIGFVVAHAIGEDAGGPASAPIELLLLLGLAIQGFTFTIAASALVVVTYGRSSRDPTALTRPLALYTAAITAWHLLLWQAIGDWTQATTFTDALVVTAAPLAACAALLAARVRGPAARRAWTIAAVAVLLVGAGLVTGWAWGGEPDDRWRVIARWAGRYRPGLSDGILLGLAALCLPLARGAAGVGAATSVVVLFAVQIVLDVGGPVDPRELAGPLRVAAAPAALLLVMLTGVRLAAGRGRTVNRPPEIPAAPATMAAPARGRARLARAAPTLFGAAIALLLLTNIRQQVRVHRLSLSDDRKVLAASSSSLAADEKQFAYYYIGEAIPGATIVIPPRLARHALFFRLLGRVNVEIASESPRVVSAGVARLARLRAARRPLFYDNAGESESVELILSPRSRRYVLAESGPRRLQLIPEPLYFWFADRQAPAPSSAAEAAR